MGFQIKKKWGGVGVGEGGGGVMIVVGFFLVCVWGGGLSIFSTYTVYR